MAYPGYLRKIPIREKSVCIVLVGFGPFPQRINWKSVKLAVWAVSLNFLFDFTLFVIDIHQIMLISLFPTPFDHFHFHRSGGLILWYDLRLWHSILDPWNFIFIPLPIPKVYFFLNEQWKEKTHSNSWWLAPMFDLRPLSGFIPNI